MNKQPEFQRVSSSSTTIEKLRENYQEVTSAFGNAIADRFIKDAEDAIRSSGINNALEDEILRLGEQERPRVTPDVLQDTNLDNPNIDLFKGLLRYRTRLIWSKDEITHEIRVVYADDGNLTIISGGEVGKPDITGELYRVGTTSIESPSGERTTLHSNMYAYPVAREVWTEHPEVVMDRLMYAFANPIDSFGVLPEPPLD